MPGWVREGMNPSPTLEPRAVPWGSLSPTRVGVWGISVVISYFRIDFGIEF
jgi:hypothetical protein